MSYRSSGLLAALLTAILAVSVTTSVAHAETFKLATIAPENSEWMRKMRAGAKEIKERTEGRVTIKLFGGGIQGNDSILGGNGNDLIDGGLNYDTILDRIRLLDVVPSFTLEMYEVHQMRESLPFFDLIPDEESAPASIEAAEGD